MYSPIGVSLLNALDLKGRAERASISGEKVGGKKVSGLSINPAVSVVPGEGHAE